LNFFKANSKLNLILSRNPDFIQKWNNVLFFDKLLEFLK